jgi:hypothetical protein
LDCIGTPSHKTCSSSNNKNDPREKEINIKVVRMKGIFWNSNEFKDKKNKFVSDLMKENNLNFIAISETGRR